MRKEPKRKTREDNGNKPIEEIAISPSLKTEAMAISRRPSSRSKTIQSRPLRMDQQ